MRIAILGAPGAGKRDLMQTLEASGEFEDHSFLYSPTDALAEQGRALGPGATYHEHFLLHALQQRDLDLVDNPLRVVMSGTVLQRLAHLCTQYDDIVAETLGQRERAERLVRLRPTIEVFTSLTLDSFRADLVFLLLRGEAGDMLNFNYEDSVQFHLRDSLDRLGITYRELIGETHQQALDIVEAARDGSTADT